MTEVPFDPTLTVNKKPTPPVNKPDFVAVTNVDVKTREPRLMHPVKKVVKGWAGIKEDEPAALMVHITSKAKGEQIVKYGFVNAARRGTLAPITDNPEAHEDVGVPSIIESKSEALGDDEVMMLTFCLPAEKLRMDDKKYGYWYDNRLKPEDKPELWDIYNGIVTQYDDTTGAPKKWAKDDPSLYPVFIPPTNIIGAVTNHPTG